MNRIPSRRLTGNKGFLFVISLIICIIQPMICLSFKPTILKKGIRFGHIHKWNKSMHLGERLSPKMMLCSIRNHRGLLSSTINKSDNEYTISSALSVSNNELDKYSNKIKLRKSKVATSMALILFVVTLSVIFPRSAFASTVASSPTSTLDTLSISQAVTDSNIMPSMATTFRPKTLGSFQILPTMAEIELSFRLFYAGFTGAVVGLDREMSERRQKSSDRPAGVRTMALVSLGACAFTLCSIYGFAPLASSFPFKDSVKVDLSRMASNVASGVGFIGAGVITNNRRPGELFDRSKKVNGLTTAAAIWVAAAAGVASGVGLYFVSAMAALGTILILHFPKDKRRRRFGQNYVNVSSKFKDYKSKTDSKVTISSTSSTIDGKEKVSPKSQLVSKINQSNISTNRAEDNLFVKKDDNYPRDSTFAEIGSEKLETEEIMSKKKKLNVASLDDTKVILKQNNACNNLPIPNDDVEPILVNPEKNMIHLNENMIELVQKSRKNISP